MNYVDATAEVLLAGLRLSHPKLRTEPLTSVHIDQAVELLSTEFCRREPLCRVLKLERADILAFFRLQVQHVAAQGLGIVAVEDGSKVRGVLTIEDHLAPFQPDEDEGLHPGIVAIGQYLEQTKIPGAILPQRRGELFHVALAAVDSGGKKAQVLMMMMLACFKHLKTLGYSKGYAKVTNPAIVRRLQKLEKFTLRRIFDERVTGCPSEFHFRGGYPFAGYRGMTSLVTWQMP